MCVCVCMYVCMYDICLYVCVYVCMYVCMYMYVCVCMYVCVVEALFVSACIEDRNVRVYNFQSITEPHLMRVVFSLCVMYDV